MRFTWDFYCPTYSADSLAKARCLLRLSRNILSLSSRTDPRQGDWRGRWWACYLSRWASLSCWAKWCWQRCFTGDSSPTRRTLPSNSSCWCSPTCHWSARLRWLGACFKCMASSGPRQRHQSCWTLPWSPLHHWASGKSAPSKASTLSDCSSLAQDYSNCFGRWLRSGAASHQRWIFQVHANTLQAFSRSCSPCLPALQSSRSTPRWTRFSAICSAHEMAVPWWRSSRASNCSTRSKVVRSLPWHGRSDFTNSRWASLVSQWRQRFSLPCPAMP